MYIEAMLSSGEQVLGEENARLRKEVWDEGHSCL
jgi:hypothetical protein